MIDNGCPAVTVCVVKFKHQTISPLARLASGEWLGLHTSTNGQGASTVMSEPLNALRYHVTGAIERGEATPIVGIPAKRKRSRRVSCDQCVALVINGVFCHEHGCPNSRKH